MEAGGRGDCIHHMIADGNDQWMERKWMVKSAVYYFQESTRICYQEKINMSHNSYQENI